MSIASEITRLQTAKADIKTAIEAKGVTVPANATLDTYNTYVANIPTGGGSTIPTATITGNTSEYSVPRVDYGTTLMTAVEVGTKMYFFGYLDTTHKNAICKLDSSNWQFTILNQTFEDDFDDVKSIACVVVGTDIYCFGGLLADGYSASNKIYKFDTTNDTLTRLLIADRTFANSTLVNIGNTIYLFGGRTAPTVVSQYIYKYDIVNNTLTGVPYSMPNYFNQGYCVVDTDIYLFGGWNGGTGSGSVGTASYKYDTLTDVLSSITALPAARDNYSTYRLYNGYIYIFGGRTRGSSNYITREIIKYDISNNSYTTLSNTLPSGVVWNTCNITIGSKIYLAGGAYSSTTPSSDIAIFDYTDDSIVTISKAYEDSYYDDAHTFHGADYMIMVNKTAAHQIQKIEIVQS